ncbi:MAG: hypothetical protein KDI71_10310 [Xanthomonadales bacterium]|nr:hypothetical protein [Xanthomonadales bacterium]
MFIYELDIRTFREFWYFLFRKKICPACGGKVHRVDALVEHTQGWERDGPELDYEHKVKEPVRYRCDPCHEYFSLAQLARGA